MPASITTAAIATPANDSPVWGIELGFVVGAVEGAVVSEQVQFSPQAQFLPHVQPSLQAQLPSGFVTSVQGSLGMQEQLAQSHWPLHDPSQGLPMILSATPVKASRSLSGSKTSR